MEKKNFKLFFAMVTVIMVVLFGSVFTSCSNDDDLLLAGDTQTEQVSPLVQDSVKAVTRSSSSEVTSLGTLYVSDDEGYVDETPFTFTLTSTTSNPINDNRVRVYILFYAPYGGTYANEMTKTVYTSGTVLFSLTKSSLSQYGTYTVRFAYTIDNANPVTNSQPFGSAFYIDIQCRTITITDDYPYYDTSLTSIDPSGFYRRYCTSWVAWKINQMWGTAATTGFYNTMYGNSESQKLGDADHWLGVLQSAGYSTNSHPKTGDIAYWSFGHVAFVNSVLNENSIIITEYNNPAEGATLNYNWRTINRNSQSWPTCFIHVQTKIGRIVYLDFKFPENIIFGDFYLGIIKMKFLLILLSIIIFVNSKTINIQSDRDVITQNAEEKITQNETTSTLLSGYITENSKYIYWNGIGDFDKYSKGYPIVINDFSREISSLTINNVTKNESKYICYYCTNDEKSSFYEGEDDRNIFLTQSNRGISKNEIGDLYPLQLVGDQSLDGIIAYTSGYIVYFPFRFKVDEESFISAQDKFSEGTNILTGSLNYREITNYPYNRWIKFINGNNEYDKFIGNDDKYIYYWGKDNDQTNIVGIYRIIRENDFKIIQ